MEDDTGADGGGGRYIILKCKCLQEEEERRRRNRRWTAFGNVLVLSDFGRKLDSLFRSGFEKCLCKVALSRYTHVVAVRSEETRYSGFNIEIEYGQQSCV